MLKLQKQIEALTFTYNDSYGAVESYNLTEVSNKQGLYSVSIIAVSLHEFLLLIVFSIRLRN